MNKEDVRVALCFLLNYVSSVGIMGINKKIFNEGFRYGTLLTIFHFSFTFLMLVCGSRMRFISFKKLSIHKVAPLCLTYSGFVALTNVSLVFNPISIAQLLKVLNTPAVVILEYVLYRKVYPWKILASLFVSVVGLTLTSATDARTTLVGTLVALSAVTVAALNQIFVGQKQKELDCNAFQLLMYQAPLSALMLLPTVPVLDMGIWTSFQFPSMHLWLLIGLSCLFAVGVNCSIFLIIGKTSPVTYNAVSMIKLVSQIMLDFIFFDGKANVQVMAGVLITLLGVAWYSDLKMKMNKSVAMVNSK